MKAVISKSAAVLFALTLGCGMAYGAMGERCGNGNSPAEKCNAGKKSSKASHCGSAKCGESKERFKKEHCGSGKAAEDKPNHCGSAKCGEAKKRFKKEHCGSGKAAESKPKSDAKCGKGKCS
jgi:hypothetical protein